MASDPEISVRRYKIAELLSDPFNPVPNKNSLAKMFKVDLKTIYRDIESQECRDRIKEIINAHVHSSAVAAAFKVVLKAILGGDEFTPRDQLKTAIWLMEISNVTNNDTTNDSFETKLRKLLDG